MKKKWYLSLIFLLFTGIGYATTLPYVADTMTSRLINDTPVVHQIIFRTATADTINTATMKFSPGFDFASNPPTLGTVSEIGTGTISIDGDTVVYTVKSESLTLDNTTTAKIITLTNIRNASQNANTYTVTVTTISPSGAIIDGPTSSPYFLLSDTLTFLNSSSYIIFSPYYIGANISSTCTAVVCVNALSGYPIPGKTVTLYTRGNSDTIYDSRGSPNTGSTQTTDVNGRCTFTIVSSYTGLDTLIAVVSGYPDDTITRGVNKYGAALILPFDTDTIDISGYGNNGTFSSNPVWVAGKYGSALQFDGIDDYVDCGDPANGSLDFGTGDFTLEAWFYLPSLPGDWKAIINKGGNGLVGYNLQISSGNALNANITVGTNQNVASAVLTAGKWYHGVGVFDRDDKIYVYLNGTQVNAADYSAGNTGSVSNALTLKIGRYSPSAIWHFNGAIDDVKIYNRALSPQEVKASFDAKANSYFLKLRVVTPMRNLTAGETPTLADSIVIQAQFDDGTKVASYTGSCTFTSSSIRGGFALSTTSGPWVNPINVNFNKGEAYVYYKDTKAGSPTISIHSDDLNYDTSQIESVSPGTFNNSSSYIAFSPYKISVNGISTCTAVVTVCDTYGNPITNKLVSLQTARGAQNIITPNPGTTDANGKCTFTISSNYEGQDTLVAVVSTNPDETITHGINKQGIVGAWLFEDWNPTTLDISGNNNNGILTNGPVYTSGKYGSALQLDGINDYVNCGNKSSLDMPTNDFTVEVWAKCNGFTNSSIISKGSYFNTGKGYDISYPGSPKNIYFNIYDGSTYSSLNTGLGETFPWSHIVGVRRGGTVEVWVNGVKKSGSYPATSITNAETFYIGKSINNVYFNGLIDEVKIYNRALAEEEILASYQGRASIYFTQNKLKITSSSFSIPTNKASPKITVEMRKINEQGQEVIDTDFNNTITLTSSSLSGEFSQETSPWIVANTTTLTAGSGYFYYKDSNTGSIIVTVSRTGITSDTQQITIFTASSFNETLSYLRISTSQVRANGESIAYITLSLKDNNSNPVFDTAVILQSTRPDSTIIFNTNPASGLTDVNGQCTWTVKTYYTGQDTFTGFCVNYPGKQIRENRVGNPSFEEGTGQIPSPWAGSSLANTDCIDTTYAYTGTRSFRVIGESATNKNVYQEIYNINNSIPRGSTFVFSGWSRADTPTTGAGIYYGLDVGIFYNTGTAQYFVVEFSKTTHDWEYKELYFTTDNNRDVTSFYLYLLYYKQTGTAWFDDISLRRVPGIRFTASNLKFVSSPFSIMQNNSSPKITAIATGTSGGDTDTTFNNTVTLTSSSSNGKFSSDGANWSTTNDSSITLTAGIGNFYYKDTNIGTPTITVSRVDLVSNAQQETITLNPNAIKLAIVTPARNITVGDISDSICVQAWTAKNVKDSGYNETCIFSTSSVTGRFSFSTSGETWTSTITLKMVQGETYVYYQDIKTGSPTITVKSGALEETSQIQSIIVGSFNNTSSYIIFTPYQIQADGTSTCTAVVTVCDTYGNPLTGNAVSLYTVRGNKDTVTPSSGITLADGKCTFTIKSSYAGQDTIIAVVSIYPDDTITRSINKYGAVGIWHFDDGNTTTIDGSGYGNNGVLANGPVYVGGKYGSALQFDGVNDYVDCGNNTILNCTSALTVEAWVRPLKGDAYQRGIVEKTIGSGYTGWSLFQGSNNNGYRFFVALTDGSLKGASTGAGTIIVDTWTHIVAVKDTSSIYIYMNGELKNSASAPLPIASNSQSAKIGRYAFFSTGDVYFNGLIDGVRIYNRVLSTEEIKASYQGRANIYFSGYKLNFTPSPFRVKAGKEVPLSISLGGEVGGVDSSFNDTCLIQSSSDSGQFSATSTFSGSETNSMVVRLVQGETQVYYRDLRFGTPTLTVSRGSEYESSIYQETITGSKIQFVSSPFTISSCDTTLIKIAGYDELGNTDTNWSETVEFSSNSNRCKFSATGASDNDTTIVLRMVSGETSCYVKNTKGGIWTITAKSWDSTWTIDENTPIIGNQVNTITQPVITVTKYHQKKNTSYNTSSIAVTSGETIAYKLTITNIGTETATNLIITDTSSFDTSVNSAVSFTGWDTSTVNSYTYSPNTTSNWQQWDSEPPKPSDNVKGLRWKINILSPNQTKYIYFEMKVK